jgi:hypothetical protein
VLPFVFLFFSFPVPLHMRAAHSLARIIVAFHWIPNKAESKQTEANEWTDEYLEVGVNQVE